MSFTPRRLAALTTAVLMGGSLLAAAPAQAVDEVTLNLIGINDFHGRIDNNTVKFAGTVEQLRQDGGDANSLVVSAGDNVSASLFASATQGDIPTIDVLNALELSASAAGNHEFDKGADDLTGRLTDAADFPFLSANTFDGEETLLEPYEIFTIDGVDVAVVGAVTEETPSLVSPAGIEGLTFADPVDSINDTVADLEALPEPPDVIVASIHDGAPVGTNTLEQNMAASPMFTKVVEETDPAVDAIFMGHTHQAYAYDAPVPGAAGETRPILQTGQYGDNVGQIKLTFDKDSGAVTDYTTRNQARTTTADSELTSTFPRVAEVQTITTDALEYAADIGNEPIGELTADITRAKTPAGAEDRGSESALGNLVADALLAKVAETPAGADIGVVNPGGLRTELLFAGTGGSNADGVITFAEANGVLPFTNALNTVTLTGTSLKKVLEQQWQRTAGGQVPGDRPYLQLGLSKNVNYTFDTSKPEGSRITSVLINGEPLDADRSYKIATFSFLATGGDNFRAFTEGTVVDTGLVDYEAWIEYLTASSPVSPDFARRTVQVAGIKDVYAAGGDLSFSLPKLNLTSVGSPANTSVSARVLYGDGQSKALGSRAVTNGASGTFAGTLPADATGPMTIRVTAFPSRTTADIPIQVKKAATIEAPAVEAVFGDDATVDVTLTGDGTPTGDVTLSDGDTEIGEQTLVEGAASFTVDTEDLGAGTNELTVSYTGDDDFAPATGTASVEVAKAGTSVEAGQPGAEPFDGTIEVDATTTSDTGTTPTGTVTVSEGDTEVATGTLEEGASTIEVEASDLGVGAHTLTVSYAGDDDHESSTTTVDVSVTKATTGLETTVSSAQYGSATLRITADEEASGLVYAFEDGDAVGLGFLKDGVATIKLDKTLTVGAHSLDLAFGGSESYDAATGSVDLTVVKASTTTSKQFVTGKIVVRKTQAYVTFDVKAAGFTVDSGTFRIGSNGKWYTTKVVNGRANVRVGAYNSTGVKTIKGEFLGNGVAQPSKGQLTVNVVAK